MSAPSFCAGCTSCKCVRKKRKPSEIRKVLAAGKEFKDTAYKPQFAIGFMCRDAADQQSLFNRLSGLLPERDLKVLVI